MPPKEKEVEIEAVRVEVAKLAMSPGQILAVKCMSILSMSQREEIAQVMKSVVPEGVKVLVLDKEFDICVVEPPNAKVSGPEAALSPEGRARLPG